MNSYALLLCLKMLIALAYSSPVCKDPSLSYLDATFKQLQAEYGTNVVEQVSSDISKLEKSVVNNMIIYGNTQCPANSSVLVSTIDATLYHRSTCPYFYAVVQDDGRFPRNTTEARCRCNGCLEKSGQSQFDVCEPVALSVRMLRRTSNCINGEWLYEPFTYQMPVACACAVAREHENSDILPEAPSDDPMEM